MMLDSLQFCVPTLHHSLPISAMRPRHNMLRYYSTVVIVSFSLLTTTTTIGLVSAAEVHPFALDRTEHSAKADGMSTLTSRAISFDRRRDVQNVINSNNIINKNSKDHAHTNLASYSVVFQKCLFVKTFSDHLAQATTKTPTNSIEATERFALFRLCPSMSSSYCKECRSDYGEYLIDLYDYLRITVEYQRTMQDNKCTICKINCASYATDDRVNDNPAGLAMEGDDDTDKLDQSGGRSLTTTPQYCRTCLEECDFISKAKGYYDAALFINCTKIYDDGIQALYTGPVCNDNGNKIQLGVFTDETCYNLDPLKDPENYLRNSIDNSMKVSYHPLKETYTRSCISCADTAANDGVATTSDFCTTLHDMSAKCEPPRFAASIAVKEPNGNAAPVPPSNDTMVCDYIHSLATETYNEHGEITLLGASTVIQGGGSNARMFRRQMYILAAFILGTIGLAVYAAKLHAKLVRQIIGSYASLSPLLLHSSQTDLQETELVEMG